MDRKGWFAGPRLDRFADGAALLLRLYLGGFLVWGVWDNVVSAARACGSSRSS